MHEIDLPQTLDLKYVSDDKPGFTRKRWGRGFVYLDEKRNKIENPAHIKRIKDLVIPPFWKNVWICPLSNGYLQVTGKDAKNRKQYLYHSDWVAYRQSKKFQKMAEFGAALPHLRKQYEKDLVLPEWDKRKVVALIIYLLDHYYFRIGNQYYANKNNTYGLTTLRRKHLEESMQGISFCYMAKSGKERTIKINDKKIARLIRETSELPGYEIFRYKTGSNQYTCVDSADVNDYLHEHTHQKFSAKDFRTWGASKVAIEYYPKALETVSENIRLKFEPTLIKLTAKKMGNTVSVCRKYYIHPTILTALSEHYPKPAEFLYNAPFQSIPGLDQYESKLMQILDQAAQKQKVS